MDFIIFKLGFLVLAVVTFAVNFSLFLNFFFFVFSFTFSLLLCISKKKLKFHFTDQKKVLLRWRGEAGEWVVVCARGRGMGRIKQFCFLNI